MFIKPADEDRKFWRDAIDQFFRWKPGPGPSFMSPIFARNPLPRGRRFGTTPEAPGKVLLISCRPQVDTSKLEASIQKARVIVNEFPNYPPSRQFQQHSLVVSPFQDSSFGSNRRNAISFDGNSFKQRLRRGGVQNLVLVRIRSA